MGVLADVQIGCVTGQSGDTDVAAVKTGIDADAHGTVIVRPDSPGKT